MLNFRTLAPALFTAVLATASLHSLAAEAPKPQAISATADIVGTGQHGGLPGV
jgi:hypothetical protein